MVNTLLMATSIGKAKGHKLLGNQCAKGRAAKLLRIFEFVKAYFTEQLQTSVFISHKHDDLDVIRGFLGFLRNMGVATYIDSFDPTMPDFTCGKTAERIKERIKQCDKFMLLATDNAITSKWCNWELGIGDVHKYKSNIAIVPVKNNNRLNYTGSEFLEIYPYLYQSSNGYFIYDPITKSVRTLKDWLRK